MKYMDAGKSMLRKSKRLFVILTVFCSTILIIKYVQLSVLYMASQEENYQWERVPFYPELTTESITNDLGYPSQTHSCLYYDGLNTFNYIGILRDFPYLLDCVIGIHKVELYESEYQFSTRLILYDEIRYFFGVPIIITKGGIELADEGISMTTIIEFYGPRKSVV